MTRRKGTGRGRKVTPPPDTYVGNALASEQDRGCVLVGGAYIEYRLEELARAKFKATPNVDTELLESVIGGPDNSQALLYSGWSKAAVLHLIGVIDRDYFKLFNRIRKLRNHFAHTAGQTLLDETAIQPIVDVFTETIRKTIENVLHAIDKGKPTMWTDLAGPDPFSNQRIIFMEACKEVNRYLVSKIHEIDPSGSESRQTYAVVHKKPSLGPSERNDADAATKKTES